MRVTKCDKCKNISEQVYQIKYRKLYKGVSGAPNKLEICEKCFIDIFVKNNLTHKV